MSINLVEGDNFQDISMVPIPPPVANLYGTVVDSLSGYPIDGVKVTIQGVIAYTNSSGQYSFVGLELGSYPVTFEKVGYNTLIL